MSTSNNNVIRIGTRESQLALLQTGIALKHLQRHFPDIDFQVLPTSTIGDKVADKPLFSLGGRGVFVKELEEDLLADNVDLVVHSLKDLPTDMPEGLVLAAVLERDDPRDVLVSTNNIPFEKLPPGSRVATSSLRRMAQLKAIRKDLTFVDIRGNIQTRLRKLDEGQCDAMVLAAAGLLRLNLKDRIAQYFDTEQSLPAVGQAALAIECRAGDTKVLSLLEKLDDPEVRAEITAERAFLDQLGGGCSVPVGGLATVKGKSLTLTVCVAALDGSHVLRATKTIELTTKQIDEARTLGIELAKEMIDKGAEDILVGFTQTAPSSVSPP